MDLYVSPSLSEHRLNLDTETTLFRVLQEALTNVHRHSGSSTARVRLIWSGEPESQVMLIVEDDGAGEGRTASRFCSRTCGPS